MTDLKHRPQSDVSSAELVRQATEQVTTLVRQEMQLAAALGETVRALAAKADVRARAGEFAHETRERATTSAREHWPQLAAIGIGALAVVAAILIWRNRPGERW